MKAFPRFCIVLLCTTTLWGQTSASAKSKARTATVSADEVQQLKDALAAQRQRIEQLEQRLAQSDQALQQQLHQAQAVADEAQAKAQQATAQAGEQQQQVKDLSTQLSDLKAANSGISNAQLKNAVFTSQDPQQTTSTPTQESQVLNKEMESTITIRFKGVNVTPGGFAAAETIYRTRALGADLPTPFNSVTMPGASQSQLGEFFGSARQSRPTVYVEGRLKNVDLSSYVSGDFLSAGTTSTSTQTNSYTFRLRQVWGQAKFDNGWSFLGGQMWSLVTENKAGIAPVDDIGRTNDARPTVVDPSYNVGFTFARQYGIRVTKAFGKTVALAFAVENPQATVTTHGNAANYLLTQPGASNSYNSLATYGFNPSPDLIAKAAFDPGFGHYEIFGLLDRFTDRVFPCVEFAAASPLCSPASATPATGAYNASKEGGGFGANARWNFLDKHVVFGLHGFGGSGVGRYGAGQLADVSIDAAGNVHLVKGMQGLSTLEWHGKKLDIYSYGGAEYAARTYDFDPLGNKGKGADVGYGAPAFNNTGCGTEVEPGTSTLVSGPVAGSLANCTADTRVLFEGTIGFWYRFYSGPKGRFQYGTQYSYLARNTWSGKGGSPNGVDNMIFTSFRYYLP